MPSDRTLFLGLDLSTTGAKAILIDAAGKVRASASTPIALSTPRPLWAEQDPHEWCAAAWASIRAAIAQSGAEGSAVAAVGLTGQMHGLVILDAEGNVLRPAILWNDQRTGAQCEEIRRRIGRERLIRVTGNDALPGFTSPKILWVRENEPEVYARIRHILLPKDYIRYRLTNSFAADKADGSGTALFDIRRRDWSAEILEGLGISAGWLPPTFEGSDITGTVSAEAAAQTGLKAGTPVMAGAGDQAAQAVGAGIVEPGSAALTLGTSGVIFAATDRAVIEPEGRLHAFCHAIPQRWHLMSVMLSAGGSLQWHRDNLAPGMSFPDLIKEAEQAPAGSEGLLFLPYLSGERTPYPDPLARGAWVGLTVRHSRPHLTRAVLEGVAFGLKDGLELIRQAAGADIRRLRLSGGGARSLLWRQILASVLELELETVNTGEGAAFGAAILAGVGAGAWPDVRSACDLLIAATGTTAPDDSADVYRRIYPRYRGLYPALKPFFRED